MNTLESLSSIILQLYPAGHFEFSEYISNHINIPVAQCTLIQSRILVYVYSMTLHVNIPPPVTRIYIHGPNIIYLLIGP